MWNPRATFAAYIPLYASCDMTFIGDSDLVAAPIRQFHGQADDWVTVAPCRPYFERLRAAGRDVKLTEYPGAHHSYDNPLGSKTPILSRNSQTTRDCVIREEPRGVLINARTSQPFSYADPCVKLDPHTGHNEAAAIATRNEVSALLKTVLKQESAGSSSTKPHLHPTSGAIFLSPCVLRLVFPEMEVDGCRFTTH